MNKISLKVYNVMTRFVSNNFFSDIEDILKRLERQMLKLFVSITIGINQSLIFLFVTSPPYSSSSSFFNDLPSTLVGQHI